MAKLTETIASLLAEVPLSVVLKERLELAKDRAEILENENVRLHRENSELRERAEEMERAAVDRAAGEKFVEQQGALFKRRDSGGYHECVYCPTCRGPMSSLGMIPFHCSPCNVSVNFTGGDLDRVMGGLPE